MQPALRHRLAADPVGLRPPRGRQVGGAEQPVDHRQVDREVAVDGDPVQRVMPVMEARRHHEPFERAQAEPHVGVDEDRVERDEDEVGVERRRREAEHVERHERQPAGEHDVDQVQPRAGQPVHRAGRVVDAMEAPEPGHRVEEAMDRIFGEVGGDDDLQELHDQRLGGHRRLQPGANGPGEEQRRRGHGQQDRQLHEHVADGEVAEIGRPAGAEDRLLGAAREQTLHRHEDEREQQEVEEKPVDAEVARRLAHRADRHVGASDQRAGQRQRDPGQAEGAPAAQQHGEHAETEARHEEGVDEEAHEGQRIERARVGRGQQPGKEQAEDAAVPDRGEGHREHAADPAGAELRADAVPQALHA